MRTTSTYILVLIFALGLLANPARGQETMFSGRVYEGQTGVEPPPLGNAKALPGVTVNLYGTDSAGLMGTYITHATSDSGGWYGLSFMPRFHKYAYYNIVATTLAEYASVGATSVGGTVRGTDWIQYEFDDLGATTTGNKFWFQPLTATENEAPVVFAGDDCFWRVDEFDCLPAADPIPVPLAGAVSDDGLPDPPGHVTIEWSLISGPGEVVFENAGDPQTMAYVDAGILELSACGTYVLRLTAWDGALEASDDVTIVLSSATTQRGDVTAPGDVVKGVPDDGDWPSGEEPPLAIDDNVGTKYLHWKGDFDPDPGTGGSGFQVTPRAGASVVTGLTFTTANDCPGRDPIAFELYGSNESIDGPYELIAVGEIVDFAQRAAWPRVTRNATPIEFDNAVAYEHYQVLFWAIRGPLGECVDSMQIAEVELLGWGGNCPVGLAFCGGECVDLQTDPDHCGACYNQCGPNFICSGGTCYCPSSYSICNGACVDLDTDPDHCGACGNQCPPGFICIGGKCVADLPPGFTLDPVGWDHMIGKGIGGALPPGSMDLCGPRVCPEGCGLVTAGGADIWGAADQFHYAYVDDWALYPPETGDFTAVVRVDSMGLPGSHGWAKAGIMVRETLDPGSPHVMIVRTPANNIALQARDTQGGQSWHVPVGQADWRVDEFDKVWLRLDRVGNTVTGSCALGGEAMPTAWLASASHEVPGVAFPFPDGLLVGLATTSHEQGVPMTATYCDFAIGPALGPPALLGPGLEACYTFDEGEGTVAHDSSGFGRHGTLVGDVQWVDGPPGLGGAVSESAGGYVSISPADSAAIAEAIGRTGRMTLMAWVDVTHPYAQWDIIRKGPDAWGLYTTRDGLGFGFRVAPGEYVEAPSAVIPGTLDGQHVAGVYDGEELHLYVDGERVTSKAYVGLIGENGFGVAIGAATAGSPWKSDVRIYSEALSQAEIAAIAGMPARAEPGLVAHYTFDEGEGTVAYDWSGFGHDARLEGDPCVVYAIPINIPAPIALEFDGIDDYVDCGTFNPSAATGQLSVCVWAKWNGLTGQYQGIIGKRDSWAADDMMWQIECNRDTGVVNAQRQGIPDIEDPTWVLPIGKWEHVAFTFDGDIGTLYRNGAAVASGPYSFGTDPGAAVVFGACQANGGNPFNGALADVRIYDQALSPREIADLVD